MPHPYNEALSEVNACLFGDPGGLVRVKGIDTALLDIGLPAVVVHDMQRPMGELYEQAVMLQAGLDGAPGARGRCYNTPVLTELEQVGKPANIWAYPVFGQALKFCGKSVQVFMARTSLQAEVLPRAALVAKVPKQAPGEDCIERYIGQNCIDPETAKTLAKLGLASFVYAAGYNLFD